MANVDLVPKFNDLSFYSTPDANKPRYELLRQKFHTRFNAEPEFFSRSPGRVNLIGDHIDYCYFSVLPMALDVDVIAAVSKKAAGDNSVTIANTNQQFQEETFDLPDHGEVIDIDQTKFTWANYFKCGLIVAHKFIIERYPELVNNGKSPLQGLNLYFDGNVPTGGGLSSSAAFCVASTLAVLRGNGIQDISKADLTRITVVSEHYVGVNTGGMDQCASIYGGKRKALLIQFKPKLIGVPFELPIIKPHDMVFLVTNSLLESNKHETAPVNYNLRAVEAATSAEYLAAKFDLKLVQDSNLSTGTLRGFLDTYYETIKGEPRWDGNDIDIGIRRLSELMQLIETEDIYTADEKIGFTTSAAAKALKLTEEEFHARFLNKFPVRYEKLKLYQRTKHIFGDSLRVLQVLKLIQQAGTNQEQFLQNFGQLMNESQVSCNLLNNASTPELEEICEIATKNGSFGSRVTGAGFGGSVVHLTTTDQLPHLIEALTTDYYKQKFPKITQEELDLAIVVSKPATGTCIVEL